MYKNMFYSVNINTKLRSRTFLSLFMSLAAGVISVPAQAAERVEFGINPITLGVSVKELETYGKEKRAGKELDSFLKLMKEDERTYIHQLLTVRSEFTALQISQLLNSAMGEKILTYLGDLVPFISRDATGEIHKSNGAKAIRTGLVLAAGDPDGLSLVNFLRKYPNSTIHLDVEKGFEITNKIEKLSKETKSMVSGVKELSTALAQSEPKIYLKKLTDLTVAGQYRVKLQTEVLKDSKRNRQFVADFYLPQGVPQAASVVVLSHGLSSDRQHFAVIARHLASHGFVAVTIDHPGSDLAKLQNLLKGLTTEIFDVSEFIDRPKDISYVLDDLTQRFPGAVNVQQAGVIGHSFGGYTALALAGATIDFDHLTKGCSQGIDSGNASLLLQCEALKLPRQTYNFRDDRIKFALAINPIDGSIFGPKGIAKIKIPVAVVAASDDTVASAVPEQVKPFSWMTAPQRYLFVVEGVGHTTDVRSFAKIFVPDFDFFTPAKGADPLKKYSHTFVLALLQTHLNNQASYRPYLQTGYVNAISAAPNKLTMLRSLTPQQFNNILR
jgi:predicted dienelactone hydrolase